MQAERRAKEGRAAQLQQLQQNRVFHGSAQKPGEKATAGAPRRLVDDGADLSVDLDLAAVQGAQMQALAADDEGVGGCVQDDGGLIEAFDLGDARQVQLLAIFQAQPVGERESGLGWQVVLAGSSVRFLARDDRRILSWASGSALLHCMRQGLLPCGKFN